MHKTAEQLEAELVVEIERCRKIVDGLSNNDAYLELVGDWKRAAEEIDSVWHLQFDTGKLNEMRITKMAALSLVGALEGYKYNLERAKEQLVKLKEQDDA